MNTITIDRAVVEQALEALEDVDGPITALLGGLLGSPDADAPGAKVRTAITALRAALAQQAEPRNQCGETCERARLCATCAQALAQQDEPETCTWHQDGDSDSGVYATSCRHYFNLEDGTPEDNKMQWCCYCGKKLVQELITEDGDE